MATSTEEEGSYTNPNLLTQPLEEYLALSLAPSTTITADPEKKQLLILDLNGTLCQRSRTKKNFCVRPHLHAFFDYIFHNFAVMVWSSAREDSVRNMCEMFENNQPFIIWSRKHFNLSAAEYYSNTETLKDLTKVWNELPEFDATNTIVLDDSLSKLAAQPYNLIQMSTFYSEPFIEDKYFMDRDLCKVANYLSLVKEQSNVCSFMRSSPFIVDLPWGTKPDLENDRRVEHYKKGKLTLKSHYLYPPYPTIPLNIDTAELIKLLKSKVPSIPTPQPPSTNNLKRRSDELRAAAINSREEKRQKQVKQKSHVTKEQGFIPVSPKATATVHTNKMDSDASTVKIEEKDCIRLPKQETEDSIPLPKEVEIVEDGDLDEYGMYLKIEPNPLQDIFYKTFYPDLVVTHQQRLGSNAHLYAICKDSSSGLTIISHQPVNAAKANAEVNLPSINTTFAAQGMNDDSITMKQKRQEENSAQLSSTNISSNTSIPTPPTPPVSIVSKSLTPEQIENKRAKRRRHKEKKKERKATFKELKEMGLSSDILKDVIELSKTDNLLKELEELEKLAKSTPIN
jgi:hypothetical protein